MYVYNCIFITLKQVCGMLQVNYNQVFFFFFFIHVSPPSNNLRLNCTGRYQIGFNAEGALSVVVS